MHKKEGPHRCHVPMTPPSVCSPPPPLSLSISQPLLLSSFSISPPKQPSFSLSSLSLFILLHTLSLPSLTHSLSLPSLTLSLRSLTVSLFLLSHLSLPSLILSLSSCSHTHSLSPSPLPSSFDKTPAQELATWTNYCCCPQLLMAEDEWMGARWTYPGPIPESPLPS